MQIPSNSHTELTVTMQQLVLQGIWSRTSTPLMAHWRGLPNPCIKVEKKVKKRKQLCYPLVHTKEKDQCSTLIGCVVSFYWEVHSIPLLEFKFSTCPLPDFQNYRRNRPIHRVHVENRFNRRLYHLQDKCTDNRRKVTQLKWRLLFVRINVQPLQFLYNFATSDCRCTWSYLSRLSCCPRAMRT